MKKFFALIIAVMYLATSNGVVLTQHLCMGKKPAKCLCSKQDNDCCKDETKVVKLEQAHKASFVSISVPAPAVLPVVHPLPVPPFYITTTSSFSPVANGPPGLPSRLHIIHCVFLI